MSGIIHTKRAQRTTSILYSRRGWEWMTHMVFITYLVSLARGVNGSTVDGLVRAYTQTNMGEKGQYQKEIIRSVMK